MTTGRPNTSKTTKEVYCLKDELSTSDGYLQVFYRKAIIDIYPTSCFQDRYYFPISLYDI